MTDSNDIHKQKPKTAVILVNLGSPTQPTSSAVRTFLRQFLSDPRVVDTNRWLWLPILYGIILPLRPRRSAKLYQKIWQPEGSPIATYTHSLANKLQQQLDPEKSSMIIKSAMRYGQPSIANVIESLSKQYIHDLVVLPLFPQYSATTTASVFDEFSRVMQTKSWLPNIRFISQYASHPDYIKALTNSVKKSWTKHQRSQHLVFSFHGIPKAYFDQGDPYYCYCHKTARLVAESLKLKAAEWTLCFQSKFGPKPWLQPYCDDVLTQLPKKGITDISVICPGFAMDCLETLEEIDITNRQLFIKNGGKQFQYIPALNDSTDHLNLIQSIVSGESSSN